MNPLATWFAIFLACAFITLVTWVVFSIPAIYDWIADTLEEVWNALARR